jgi:hypothetical protein
MLVPFMFIIQINIKAFDALKILLILPLTAADVPSAMMVYIDNWAISVACQKRDATRGHYHVNDWWISLTQINARHITTEKVEFRIDMK